MPNRKECFVKSFFNTEPRENLSHLGLELCVGKMSCSFQELSRIILRGPLQVPGGWCGCLFPHDIWFFKLPESWWVDISLHLSLIIIIYMHHSHCIYMYLHILFFAPFVYAYSELMIIFFYLGPNSPFWWMRECVEKLVPDASSPDRSKVFFTHWGSLF